MPRILNFGSINVDFVYQVDHFVRPGETIASIGFSKGAGGKGFNQSIALARAGATVSHGGRIGLDSAWLRDRLTSEGVETSALLPTEIPAGHAIIQVDRSGQNSILLHPGANHAVAPADLPEVFKAVEPGDWFLTQNETSCVPESISAAHEKGLTVCFNPAPMNTAVDSYPLEIVDWLILNETEGEALTGETAPSAILRSLRKHSPKAHLVFTLGADGVWCEPPGGKPIFTAAHKAKAVDTTAAGDTFIGYLLAATMRGTPLIEALGLAAKAAAIAVTRPGAADSIPHLHEVKF